jgi:integrase
MSVERRILRNGRTVYRVRWREGGHYRARAFDRKRDAEAADAEIRRRDALGEFGILAAGRETLADFAREWWRLYAEPNLARKTLEVYADLWDRHVLPCLGGFKLHELTPELLESFQVDLRSAGVGDPTIVKALSLLQGMLTRAVIWRRITSNPAAAIRKPPQRRTRAVRPLAPASVERLRRELGSERDRALVSVLAYAGLRPGEALALTWADVRERTLLVERAVSLGEEKETKTRRRRSVRLVGPLAADLAAWRMRSGRPPETALVFPRSDGRPWHDTDWRNWRQRAFATAAEAAGLDRLRPYDLRHSFVSLLIAEGASIVEIARQAGHSPTVALDTYGHVLEELEGDERRTAEEVIRRARDELDAYIGANGVAQALPTARRTRSGRAV